MDWEDLARHSFKEHLPTEEDPSSDDADGHTFETLIGETGDYADALKESAEHMAELHEEEKSDRRWEAAVAEHKAELRARYEEEADTRARELGYVDDDITVWEGNPLGPEAGRLLLQDAWEADYSTRGPTCEVYWDGGKKQFLGYDDGIRRKLHRANAETTYEVMIAYRRWRAESKEHRGELVRCFRQCGDQEGAVVFWFKGRTPGYTRCPICKGDKCAKCGGCHCDNRAYR